jgi:hypothetical protein
MLAGAVTAFCVKPSPNVQPIRPMADVSSDWRGECYETPNGETITGTEEFAGRLFVFTESSVFELVRPLK